MTASAPWSVKGIDAKAREVAKDLARRSGMTLGEWLNQMILEGQDVGALISRESERAPLQSPAFQRSGRHEADVYDDRAYDDRAPAAYARPQAVHAADLDLRSDRRPVRAPAYSSAAQPLAGQRDLRRSIFEDRPRQEERPRREEPVESHELSRVARALENLGSRIENSETRSAGAVRGVSSAVESLLSRLERTEAATAEAQGQLSDHAEAVTSSFERLQHSEDERTALAERLETAERLIDAQAERLEGLSGHLRDEREKVAKVEAQLKSPQAIETVRAVEGALGKLANQLYEGDVRTRETMKDVREDMVGLSHRLAQVEMRDPERAAQAVIDKVVAKMAQRLESAEAQTSTAIRALEQAFSSLDARLSRSEASGDITDPESVKSLSAVAADLSRRVEQSRYEMLEALQTGQKASVEQAVAAMTEKLDAVEKSQAGAIGKMAQDVMRISEKMGRRVANVERSQAESMEVVKSFAETADGRFGRNESAHAQALERLGGEIARISERLNVRLTDSERRTAQVLTGVGDEMIQQREMLREDIADRFRQSDERTAKWLEEARQKLEARVARVQTQSLLAEAARPAPRPEPRELPSAFATPAPAQASVLVPAEAEKTPFSAYAGGFEETRVAAAHKTIEDVFPQEDDVDLTGKLLDTVTDVHEFKPEFDPFEDDGLDSDLVLSAPLREAVPDVMNAPLDDDSDPFAEIEMSRKTAPRSEFSHIEPARPATAFVARPPREDTPPSFHEDQDSAVSVSTRDALAAARAAVRASMEAPDDRPLGNLKSTPARGRGEKPAKQAGGGMVMKTATASSVAVAAILVLGGGLWGLDKYESRLEKTEAGSETATAPATALTVTAVPLPDAQDRQNLKDQFDAATQALDAGAPDAVDKLKAVANLRYPPAEYRLSGLYAGENTKLIQPNVIQQRLWTKRAAEDGVPEAMNNLGRMYYAGTGGPLDYSSAAMWFRKAAERGVRDSQANLGILYQSGVGVPISPSEAYTWYAIAGKGGDKEAAKSARAMASQLSTDQKTKADATVKTFKPVDDGQPPLADTDSIADPQG